VSDPTKPTQARSISSQRVRDLLVSISLGNLVVLSEWTVLFHSYFQAPQPSRFVAIMLCSLLFAAVFLCGTWLGRRTGAAGRIVARWAFFQIIVISIFGLILQLSPTVLLEILSRGSVSTVVAASSLLLVPFLLVVHPAPARFVATLLVAVSPCVAFLFTRATWEMVNVAKPEMIRGSLRPLERKGPRTLLIVFDELSEYVAFTHRPPGIEMPAFDRLRREATVAAAAFPPGGITLTSMPSYLTGRVVQAARPVSRRELDVRFLGENQFKSFSDSSTIFTEVRSMGLGTAMIGWYHPYCTILRDVDFCAHALERKYERHDLRNAVLDVFAALPYLRYTHWSRRWLGQAQQTAHFNKDSFLRKVTQEALGEFRSGLMIVHLPTPHPPVLRGQGVYFSNLAEADNTLAAIRSMMEKAGTWEGATVLVTTDHWWRTREVWAKSIDVWNTEEKAYIDADKDKRATFIVKLPGKNRPDIYTPEFNTLILTELVRQSLAGKFRTSEELKAWLDVHRTDVPVHVYSVTQKDK
jgi:hypothetical protein